MPGPSAGPQCWAPVLHADQRSASTFSPRSTHLFSDYFPDDHACRNVPYANQSTAVGIVTAASYAGTALAFGISPFIISTYGWPVSVRGVIVPFLVTPLD